jgi:hypothetical protein
MKCTVLLALGLGAGIAFQGVKPQDPQDKLKEFPAAVRAAAEKALAGATVTAADKEVEHGCVSYEINGKTKDGMAVSFTFTGNGELMVEERAMPTDKLPAAVAAALTKKYAGAKTLRAETVVKHLFEVVVEVDGKKHAVEVEANGAIVDSGGDEEADKDESAKKDAGKEGKGGK